MSKVLITESYLNDIANAIRGKLNLDNTYNPSQMAQAIKSIQSIVLSGSASITQNGNADIVSDGMIIQLSTLLTWNNTASVSS